MRALLVCLPLLFLAPAPPVGGGDPLPPGYTDTVVASGFTQTTSMAFLPDGRIVVTELTGGLWLTDGTTTKKLADIPAATCGTSETGLLGIAVNPSFAVNGYLYLYRAVASAGDPCTPDDRVNEVTRVTVGPGDTVDLASLTTLISVIHTDSGMHNGGGLTIGNDHKLYIATGDTGAGDFGGGPPGSCTNPYSQDLSKIEGKILRLNLDGSIPEDNPYLDVPGARPEIYAYGLRNPFRITRDTTTNKIFIGEVGEADIEEINLLAGATNYGWPQAEGTLPLGTAGQNGDTLPIYQYSHFADPNIGGAITGVAVSPAGFGDLGGRLFFCDFNSHKIYHLPLDPTHTTVTGELTLFAKGMLGPTDLWFGPASPGSTEPALFYVEYGGGAVRRITQPAPDPYTYDPLGGKKIVVRMKPNKWLSVQSTGETDIGDSNGSPLVDGGSVRVTATGIDATYPLPAARWKPVLKSGAIVGYNYKDHKKQSGPIRRVYVKGGKSIQIEGIGTVLDQTIGPTDPGPVRVELLLGKRKYRMEFGGNVVFKPGQQFLATGAPAPTTWP